MSLLAPSLLPPTLSLTSTPPLLLLAPRFRAQELHGKQQRQRAECQPPDSRQGLLGVDGFRPPQCRGVRVLLVEREATAHAPPYGRKHEKKKKKKRKKKPPRKLAPHCLTIRVYLWCICCTFVCKTVIMQYTYAKFCRKALTVQGLFVSGFLWFLSHFGWKELGWCQGLLRLTGLNKDWKYHSVRMNSSSAKHAA